jgi:hypothetical protein
MKYPNDSFYSGSRFELPASEGLGIGRGFGRLTVPWGVDSNRFSAPLLSKRLSGALIDDLEGRARGRTMRSIAQDSRTDVARAAYFDLTGSPCRPIGGKWVLRTLTAFQA